MMESFKRSQEVGKRTDSILSELSGSTVEGTSADGAVRVFADGNGRPTGVDIDESYLSMVAAAAASASSSSSPKKDDLEAALTSAMQDAHRKSTELMEEKAQALYAEIGLGASKS